MCRLRSQHLLFAIHQPAGIERSNLKPMPMRNRIRRASLHTIPAKNTSIVVDVVDVGVALGAAYAVFGGVFGGFDVDAVRRAGGGAEKTGYAFFQAVFVALQYVDSAESGPGTWRLSAGLCRRDSFPPVVGWNISMKVMLMPLAMAAMFFSTCIPG